MPRSSLVRGRFARIAACCLALAVSVAARAQLGEFGGDLEFLRAHYTPPRSPGESNFYFDLWSPGALPVLGRVNGLTNNQALFIDSHGKGLKSGSYVFYPSEELLGDERAPYFTARDFAQVMGQANAARVRNIVTAGCNDEGRFRSSELRRYFPNATNITYMPAGNLAYKPMFYQAIVLPSSEIKPFYGQVRSMGRRTECKIVPDSTPGARRLGAYVADLYLPGARRPYQTQSAGRELLDPCWILARAMKDAEPLPAVPSGSTPPDKLVALLNSPTVANPTIDFLRPKALPLVEAPSWREVLLPTAPEDFAIEPD